MNQKEVSEIGNLFLRKFTLEVLMNLKKLKEGPGFKYSESIKEKTIPEIKNAEPLNKEIIQKQDSLNMQINQNKPSVPQKIFMPQRRMIIPQRMISPQRRIITPQKKMILPQRNNPNPAKLNISEVMPSSPSNSKEMVIPGMERLEPILNDPSVQSIECPGPEKPLIIDRSGTIQTANIILSSDEIKSIMEDLSQKTKIPLISGVFKAAFGKYIITAVISDFVGIRFAIQKKNPFSYR